MDTKKILSSKPALATYLAVNHLTAVQLQELLTIEKGGRARKTVIQLLESLLEAPEDEPVADEVPAPITPPEGYVWAENITDGDFDPYIAAGGTVTDLIAKGYLLPTSQAYFFPKIGEAVEAETAETVPDVELPLKAPTNTEEETAPEETGLVDMTLGGRVAQVHPLSIAYFKSYGWQRK